jgi:hypothetical protein
VLSIIGYLSACGAGLPIGLHVVQSCLLLVLATVVADFATAGAGVPVKCCEEEQQGGVVSVAL